jgi:hypothetical protein
MLKALIRSEVKEAVILLVFASLMFETLTPVTMALVIIGAVMTWFHKRPKTLTRNLLTLGIFASYWITYGKVIDPEVGINFLTTIIVLKLLEKETDRDRYMIFFGLILVISAGSLFQKSISYVIFFALSFFILIQDFYKTLKLPTKLLNLVQSLVWVLPFTAFLFFLAPRMINPFQLEKGPPGQGEVGYTPDVNLNQIESLASNESPVFQVSVSRPIEAQDLYWRGNTLSFTDGWNWPLMPQDRHDQEFDSTLRYDESGIHQRIRVFSQQDYYFGFDHPNFFVTPRGAARLNDKHSLSQHRWRPSQRYEVYSHPGEIAQTDSNHQVNLSTGPNRKEKIWINQTFKSETVPALSSEIENYFMKNKFSYSLSPGRVEDLLDFFQNKKIGFCSHYASAVAQIFRAKNIPARLVSGFMGGSYNRYAGFYLITQNDAHVWVEALHQGKWLRLDPTGWIAPDRVRLGGESYMQQMSSGPFSALNVFRGRINFLNDFRQWFGQWDYRFYQWLDEMDYYGQAAWLDRLSLKREWIFSLVPILLALFMGLYAWHLSRGKAKTTEVELLWVSFKQKMKKRGVDLELVSLGQTSQALISEDQRIKEIYQELVQASFNSQFVSNIAELKKKIRGL